MPWPPLLPLVFATSLAVAAPAPGPSRAPQPGRAQPAHPAVNRRAALAIRRRALDEWLVAGPARLESVKDGIRLALARDPALAADDTLRTFCRVFGVRLPGSPGPREGAKAGEDSLAAPAPSSLGPGEIRLEGISDPADPDRALGEAAGVRLAALPEADRPRFLRREPPLDRVKKVELRVLIWEDGRIADVTGSDGEPAYPAIAEAIRRWRLEPCRIAGRAVAVWALIAVGTDTPPPSTAPPPAPIPRDDEFPSFGSYVYVDELPEAITKVAPVYPQLAREAGIEGTVMVQALVGKDGLVKDTRIVKSIPMLDRAAMECVLQWVFKPALTGGQPVAVWVAVPVRFSLH